MTKINVLLTNYIHPIQASRDCHANGPVYVKTICSVGWWMWCVGIMHTQPVTWLRMKLNPTGPITYQWRPTSVFMSRHSHLRLSSPGRKTCLCGFKRRPVIEWLLFGEIQWWNLAEAKATKTDSGGWNSFTMQPQGSLLSLVSSSTF